MDKIINLNSVPKTVDVLIVGGGLTGKLLHIALTKNTVNCLLIDKKTLNKAESATAKFTTIQNHSHPSKLEETVSPASKDRFDARSLALASASIRILKTLGLWDCLERDAAPIEKIHVSQQGKFGSTLITSPEDEKLGFVIEMQILQNLLAEALNPETILDNTVLTNFDPKTNIATISKDEKVQTIKAKLIVAADGTNSILRNFCTLKCEAKEFKELALVANLGLARPHANIAYERFTEHGPLAILPMTRQRAALVWSLPADQAMQMCNLKDTDFLKSLQETFGYRLGKFIKVGTRATFPLKQSIMPVTHENFMVFIGNAAHTLHPVAGQGFNLGLRDVAALAECISKYGLDKNMLIKYQAMRNHNQKYIKIFTENLIKLFSAKIPGFSNLRGLGLLALDNTNFGKSLLEKYTRGFGGTPSDLVCGISLNSEDSI